MTPDHAGSNHYLLDASCFYALADDPEKRLTLRTGASSASTSILAVAELSCIGDTEEDFLRRKAAMRALTAVRPSIIEESPDDIVARAFGRPEPDSTRFDAQDIARAFELAASRDESVRGVKDPLTGRRVRLSLAAGPGWKAEVADRYRTSVMLADRYVSEFVREDSPVPDTSGGEVVTADSDSRPDALSAQPDDRFISLLGVAIRSGLLSECQTRYKDNFLAVAAEFVPLVLERYNGKLEPYISMELAYRKSLAPDLGPETNDVFRLEYFLHLDAHDVGYTFVTAENKWIELGRAALPGRVRALDDVLGTA